MVISSNIKQITTKRGIDLQRFIKKIGEVSSTEVKEITLAIVTIMEFDFN